MQEFTENENKVKKIDTTALDDNHQVFYTEPLRGFDSDSEIMSENMRKENEIRALGILDEQVEQAVSKIRAEKEADLLEQMPNCTGYIRFHDKLMKVAIVGMGLADSADCNTHFDFECVVIGGVKAICANFVSYMNGRESAQDKWKKISKVITHICV